MSEQDARFRLMFERSADAILLLDTEANLFVEYNQAALDMLRCTRAELSALHPSVLSPPTQPDGVSSFTKANEMIATAMRNGSHRFEWVHRSPHRDDFPVEVLLTPLPLGAVPIVVVVWRDITERKRSEEALRQAQRLESLAVLAGGIAHDFNNLLTAMSGHLHAARSAANDRATTGPAAAEIVDHVTQVEHAVSRAASLTRQLLAYGGHGTVAKEPVDLSALVREMVDLLRISLPPGVQVTCALEETGATVEADPGQLQQVIINLVANAGEAMATNGGSLSVRVFRAAVGDDELQRDFLGQGLRAGPMVWLEVADTGVGMTPEVQARIFEPFFSTKASGRGLGLSALRGIVRAHQGGVQLTSAPQRGTTFRVALPTTAASPSARPRRAAEGARGRGTVLVVDDEATVRRSLSMLVRSIGFEVIEADGGERALELFDQHRATIRWVLMDVTMPRMDGHATFLELRRRDPAVVVILSSGWAEEELARRFADQPPSAFVPKPFTVPDLVSALGRLRLVG
ncbi:MAG: response regulator [Deltaproteobacteria bacterium]|nr:response regulator [Deltaproteobacteria bacterium]